MGRKRHPYGIPFFRIRITDPGDVHKRRTLDKFFLDRVEAEAFANAIPTAVVIEMPSRVEGSRTKVQLSLEERFESMVDRSGGPDACHTWIGTHNGKGYGTIGMDRGKDRGRSGRLSTTYAHRVAFFLHNGYWPEICMHSCDNPSCVNIRHLSNGTQKENLADMVHKGRAAKGGWNAKLSASDKEAIRARSKAGELGTVLAREYGVSKSSIYYAIREQPSHS